MQREFLVQPVIQGRLELQAQLELLAQLAQQVQPELQVRQDQQVLREPPVQQVLMDPRLSSLETRRLQQRELMWSLGLRYRAQFQTVSLQQRLM